MDTPATPTSATDAPPRFSTGGVTTISAAHAVHDTYTAFLSPLLPAFKTQLALTNTQAGLLTVFLQVPSLAQPFIGHAADRISLRYPVILAPAVAAVVMSLLGIAPSYLLLAVMLLIAGINSAGLHSVGPVMAGYLSGRSLGRGMGFWMVGGELGRTLGPIVIVSAVGWLGQRGTPWLMLGGLAITGLLFARLRDVPGRARGALPSRPWREALRAMGPLLPPLAGILLLRGFVTSALTTYLPLMLSESGESLWQAGASLTVLEAAGVVGALAGGAISDRFGRRRVLAGSFLATPLLMFAFLPAAGALRIGLLLLMGFTSLSGAPVIMAMMQENYPENRALANGIYMALSFGIQSGTVLIYGAVSDLFGLHTAFAASAVAALAGLPLIALLQRG
jgi:FSR family fosmidomycin resistance protein-like MFS transporter